MNLSIKAITNGFFLSFFALIAITFMFQKKRLSLFEIKVSMLWCLLSIIRFFIPVEFFFTHTIISRKILPVIDIFLTTSFFHMKIYHIIYGIYIIGIINIIIRKFTLYTRLKKLLSYAIPIKDNRITDILNLFEIEKNKKIKVSILQSNYISEPIITGIFHTTIFLPPTHISSENLYYILRHELEHYFQHDLIWKFLLEILSILQWWNPLIYFLKKYFNTCLEIRTDLSLTKQLSIEERLVYLETLLQNAKIKQLIFPILTLHLSEKKSSLKKRFEIILYEKKKSFFPLHYIKVLLPIICFISSSCFIIEPYYIFPEQIDESFSLDDDTCYFIKHNGKYTLFVNNEKLLSYTSIPEDFQNIEIRKEHPYEKK